MAKAKAAAKAPAKTAAKGKSSSKEAPKLSLKWRLKAWWEGYDTKELEERMRQAAEAKQPKAAAEAEKSAEEMLGVPLPNEHALTQDALIPDPNADPWSDERVDVAQLVWGPGFCGPGGPEQVIALSKLLTLTPEMSMMDLAAGLGGPARALAEHFGVWVTGYEMSETLVNAGNDLSTRAGMSKKAALTLLDIASDKPFDRRYDRALGNSFLSQVKDKPAIIAKIDEALKPEGLLLILDYVLNDGETIDDIAVANWLAKESKPLHLVDRSALSKMFEPSSWTVRVDDDLTPQYIALVTEAWRGADKIVAQLMSKPEQAPLAPLVLKEAEFWMRRVNLFKSGKLQMRRILAAKREKGAIKTMSNW
jgi:2-polyprenyl-3-methyl-5-hydroxy-6-metoxy-1,4-benzoquinol methylase